MYRTIKRTPTSLKVNETMEGETIEKMIERRLNNGETAQDNIMKDLIYQPREEGVNPPIVTGKRFPSHDTLD